jgi:hypothetical protein
LVIGPWGHPDSLPNLREAEVLPWLRFWLREEGADPTSGDRVSLYRTGADRWETRREWFDVRSSATHVWHPFATGVAVDVLPHVAAVPPATNAKPQLLVDPTGSGMGLWGEQAVFDGEPIDRDLCAEGPVAFTALLSTRDCADIHLHIRLSVLRPDGACVQLCEGRLPASHRALDAERSSFSRDGDAVVPWHPHDAAQPLHAGEVVECVVEMDAICHEFSRGDRLRVGLTLARADGGLGRGAALFTPESRLVITTTER